jgi:hypothetical protein
MPNTLVGSINVNNSKLIKLKGNLAFPGKPSHPRGLLRGASLPKKWSHFFAKNSTRKRAKYVSTLASSESRRGVGGQAERMCEPEIAYASARIRPFSLASGPAGCSRKSNSPNPNSPKQRKKQNNAINKKHHLNLQVLKYSKSLLVYLHSHAARILTFKQKRAKCPAIFRLGACRR